MIDHFSETGVAHVVLALLRLVTIHPRELERHFRRLFGEFGSGVVPGYETRRTNDPGHSTVVWWGRIIDDFPLRGILEVFRAIIHLQAERM